MALSIGSKLINCGEVLDWTLLLEGTGHVARLYKPLHQCSDAQLAMVLQIWRCCEVYDRCSKGSGTQQLILKLLRLGYGSVTVAKCQYLHCGKALGQNLHIAYF